VLLLRGINLLFGKAGTPIVNHNGAGFGAIDGTKSIASGLVWDGIDQATGIAQLIPGHFMCPTYDFTADAGGGYDITLLPGTEGGPAGWGNVIRWNGLTIENTNTGYGAMGYLHDNFLGGQVLDVIKSYTDLSLPAHPASTIGDTSNALPYTGWTAACVYRVETLPTAAASLGANIFGRVCNAFETSPYSFWNFYLANSPGGNKPTFAWNNNGADNNITWSSGAPNVGDVVALVATATTNITSTQDYTGATTITDVNGDVWKFGTGGDGRFGQEIYKNGVDHSAEGWILVKDKDGRVWAAWYDNLSGPPPWNYFALTAGTSGALPIFDCTVDYYGGVVGAAPTHIGSAANQVIPGYAGNNESQIMWGSVYHIGTGYVFNVLDGNVFRGSFWNRPLTSPEITSYIANPDFYHIPALFEDDFSNANNSFYLPLI
jgi:hypothetical protein